MMKSRSLLLLALLGLVALIASPIRAEETPVETRTALPEFNQLVLDVVAQYPTDGTHDYWWPRAGESSYDGCSKDLFLDGVKVMEGEPERRTFCCGFTLEVFLEAYNKYIERHPRNGGEKLTPETWAEFQRIWFVTDVNGPGPSAALEKFGVGREIKPEEVLAGDFVQIWRRWDKEKKKNGSGHSVIFLEWVRNETGEITGMKYFSTQPGTKGIAENIEHFGSPEESQGIAAEFTFYGRVEIPTKDMEGASN